MAQATSTTEMEDSQVARLEAQLEQRLEVLRGEIEKERDGRIAAEGIAAKHAATVKELEGAVATAPADHDLSKVYHRQAQAHEAKAKKLVNVEKRAGEWAAVEGDARLLDKGCGVALLEGHL